MNDYEERKQARIDRLHEKADRARAESHSLFKQSTDMASAIPFGQPVHGPADRRYRDKIGRKMDQSIAASEKAEYYERRAQAAENNTAISSNDPEALAKLKEKLEDLQISQTRMKQINAYYKKNGTCWGFHGLSDELADKLGRTYNTTPGISGPSPPTLCPITTRISTLSKNALRSLLRQRSWAIRAGSLTAARWSPTRI